MTDTILNLLRWPLIVVLCFAILALLYKTALHRTNPKWRWVTPGSIVAVLLWLLGSAGFGWYIESFGAMSKTYGSLAADRGSDAVVLHHGLRDPARCGNQR